ncbi:hypothetical protein ACN2WE_19500 [Streptomyces sp. cg28]|uniref:hypothetical protein n=1 Tax=Streptomyces sp. cg28 TaxID=3403457 RepID=UPI003B21DF22
MNEANEKGQEPREDPQDKEQDRDKERTPRQETPGAGPDPAPTPDPEPAPAGRVQYNNVHQNFYGALDAHQAQFGIGGADLAGTRRRAIGRMDAGEVAAAVASYVEPDCFDAAAGALDRDRVVVLVGPQGTGKRAAAVALLKDVAGGAEYVVLSPDRSLEELAGRHPFGRGVGYLLLDRMHEGPSKTEDFDWRRIRDKVREEGAHLVVTTVHELTGAAPESVRHVRWQPPDLAGVARLRLRKAGCAEETVERAVELLPAGCLVAEVAAAADRIAAGDDPAVVWRDYGTTAAQPVRDWFAAERTLQEIAEVTALVFVTGTGRRNFESRQASLEPYLAAAFPGPPAKSLGEASAADPPEDGAAAAVPAPRPSMDRRRSLSRNELAVTREFKQGSVSRTVVVPPTPQYRQWILEELWAGHSTSYWDGVRDWLTELVRGRLEPESQLSIASGLALLSRPAFDEVAECYLHPWARGEAGSGGQAVTTLVLSWMCLDESLAATALVLARGWAQSGDERLRATAAVAFSGQLGVRFPTDAVKWLWHLIARRDGRPAGAVRALADLVAALAECEEDARVVFGALAHRLRVQRRTAVTTFLKETTLDTVLTVLAARDLRTGQPACASLVGRQPHVVGLVGELWAGVLRNRPRRGKALRTLHSHVRALDVVSEQPKDVAARLGAAVGAALPEAERDLLDRSLRDRPQRGGETAGALIDTFLTAVVNTED